MKNYVIFFDNDGVFAHTATWNNTTCLRQYDFVDYMSCLDIYKFNKLDKMMQNISDEYNVYGVCISTWKSVFDNEKNVKLLTERANLKKIQIYPINKPPRFSYREPWERLELIDKGLEELKPEDYIILEDEFANDMRNKGHKHVIETDQYDGLLHKHFLEIDKIIQTWQVKPEYKKKVEEYNKALDTLLSCII